MNKKIIILIDNGHGVNTLGKCSPDGRLREYAWCRDVAGRIVSILKGMGYEAVLVTPETKDIPLKERVRRVNDYCKRYGSKNCLCISVHNNAAGSDGKWHDATGWSGWVAPNASSNSKRLAQWLYKEAERAGLQGNRCVPAEKYWVGNWAICRDTNCPAVLTENLFQDNKGEVDYLLTENGKQTIAMLHVKAIINYIDQTDK